MSPDDAYFRKCSTCKDPIGFEQKYYTCSVSTCNRPRLALYFCSLPCWEAHVPEARHRDAWAEEQRSPTRDAWLEQRASESSGASTPADASRTARIVTGLPAQESNDAVDSDEILVVVSKLKKYVRDQSGMNTSDGAMTVLSNHLRALARQAIRHAAEDGRKTVMDRDFLPFVDVKK
ncbi:MAG: hypothetical protein QM784_24615 [Polyangiaceae bacterium]